MKIYEIPSEIELLLNQYSNAFEDEERNKIADKIHALELEKDQKITAIIKSIRNLMATKQAVKNEIDLLKEKDVSTTNHLNRLKDFLSSFFGGYKPQDCPVPFHWSKRNKVMVYDEAQVPEWAYVRPEYKEPEPRLSLKAIESQWKEGSEVPGTSYNEVWVPNFPSKAKEEPNE